MITELVLASSGTSSLNGTARETEFLVAQIGQLTAVPAWEWQIDEAALRLRTRPGLLVDRSGRISATGEITVPLYFGTGSILESEMGWAETALAMFPDSRYMPKDQSADVELARSAASKPIQVPLPRKNSR